MAAPVTLVDASGRANNSANPVSIGTVRPVRDLRWMLLNESRALPQALNNLGSQAQASDGTASASINWRTAAQASKALGKWWALSGSSLIPVAGRAYVFSSITVETTEACDIQLQKQKPPANHLYGTTLVLLVGWNDTYAASVDATGKKHTFDFPDGLVVHSGERLSLYYTKPGDTGTTDVVPNWEIRYEGYDVTDDFDADLPVLLVIGDSISVTADTSALKYQEIAGTITNCLFPFGVKAKMAAAGKPVRIVNLSIGGTNAADWAWLASQGRLDHIRAIGMIVNLGMNDAASSTQLSSVAGAANDGNFKKAIKSIITAFRRRNPTSPVILNSITATDEASRVTVVSGNALYNGLTRVAAYRAELAAVVADLAPTMGAAIQLAATDTAYSAASGTPYIASNQTAGMRIHPNDTVGQPAMVPLIWSAMNAAGLGV